MKTSRLQSSRYRPLLLVASLVTGAMGISPIASAQTYRLTDLGTMGALNAFALGINNTGQVVGFTETAAGATRPFLWSSATMTDLGTLGGSSAQAIAINSTGQVAGVSYLSDQTTQHATLWTSGTLTDLGTLGGAPSNAQGMNDSGQVVGTSFNGANIPRAFLWSGGVISDLGSLNGATGKSFANGISAAGAILGFSDPAGGGTYHSALWQGGTITDLTLAWGGNAIAINSVGQIVGLTSGGLTVWNSGVPTILTASPFTPSGINTAGEIVGDFSSPTYSTSRGALFLGGNVLDVNMLLDPTSPNVAYITLTNAVGINDSGWIIANSAQAYCVPPNCTTNNPSPTHAFLLTPEVLSLTVTPASVSFGNQPVGKASAAQPITVTNTAATAFGFNPFTLPADYSQTNNCGASLAASATCTIQVSFTPTALGTGSASLAVASGGTSYPVSLTGFGAISAGLTASVAGFTVTPSTIPLGTPVTLTWVSTAGSTCTPTGGKSGDGWSGNLAATGSQAVTESSTGQFTYIVTCTGGGSTAQAQVAVTVSLLTAAVTASQSSVTVGQPVTLTWNAPLATTCTMSGGGSGDGWAGIRPGVPTNSISITESTAGTFTYAMACTAGTQSATAQAVVTDTLPAVTLTTNATSVNTSQPVTLTWTSTNATACSASGGGGTDGWPGAKGTSGSASVTETAAGALTFTLTCTAAAQSAQAQAQLTVNAPVVTPPPAAAAKSGGGGAVNLPSLLALLGIALIRARRLRQTDVV